MTPRLIPTLAFLMLAAPAGAQDLDLSAMTDDQKAAFGEAVRDYLLENPEVLLEAMQIYEADQQAAQIENDRVLVQSNSDALFDDGHSWVGGNPDGSVTVVEFLDYRCSYCRRAYEEVNALVEDDGDIRFVVKEFPILGEASELSSRFAIAVKQIAGDEVYEQAHDRLMTLRGDVTLDSLSRLAEDLGQDPDTVIRRMNEEPVSEVIRQNRQLAEQMRIQGTPTFVIGGEMLRGYVPREGMEQVVKTARDAQEG